ncbi:MAG TPA: hypothetical protein VEQ36_16470 [Thermomicrobiales bacterium]|nr:hypothetical protein [Thermomicrobiales bacterium]
MLERTTISQPDRPPGILEHLSEGMSLVLAFPQLIAIPVLLDIYLLIGARISPAAMTTRLGDWLVGRNGANSVDAGEWVRGLGDWDMSRLLAFLMPSVMDGMKQDAIYRPFDRMAWSPSLPTAIATSLGLLLVGSFIFTVYLVLLASQADMIRTESRSTMRLIIDRWGKVLATTVVLTLAIGAISALFIVPGAVLSAGGMSTDTIVGLFAMVGFVVLVITMFVPESIVIDGSGPVEAIRASAHVVFRFFWQSAAFFAVSLLISPGLLSIWERIAGDPGGLGIAIVLNAVMVTSLSLASLAFYRARFDGVAPIQQSI